MSDEKKECKKHEPNPNKVFYKMTAKEDEVGPYVYCTHCDKRIKKEWKLYYDE